MEFQRNEIEELKFLFDQYKIDWKAWCDLSNAKSIDFLFREIMVGETELKIEKLDLNLAEKETLVRHVRVAEIDVFTVVGDQTYEIYEVDQIIFLPNGEKHVRSRDIDSSMGEKLVKNEMPIHGAHRGLNEELAMFWHTLGMASLPIESIQTAQRKPVYVEKYKDSRSYPGLMTRTQSHRFQVRIVPEAFELTQDLEFYEEHENVLTRFAWRDTVRHPA